jgi:hypothetical protein
LFRAWQIYRAIRHAARSGRSECALSRSECLALISKWWLFSLAANLVQIAASALSLQSHTVNERFVMLGWSSFFAWLTICQYFEHFPGYYSTFSTISGGISSVCRFMLSVMPILSAFAFLGMCLFWKASIFQGPGAAYASLFALLNGDMVHDSFLIVGDSAGIVGYIYIYAFIFIFIYVVLNVNITIIEEAFYKAREKSSSHAPTHPVQGNASTQGSFQVQDRAFSFEQVPGPGMQVEKVPSSPHEFTFVDETPVGAPLAGSSFVATPHRRASAPACVAPDQTKAMPLLSRSCRWKAGKR